MIFFVWSVNEDESYSEMMMVDVEDGNEAEAFGDKGFGAFVSVDPDFTPEWYHNQPKYSAEMGYADGGEPYSEEELEIINGH